MQVEDLGYGAFATVAHCKLANWRDPAASAAGEAVAAAANGGGEETLDVAVKYLRAELFQHPLDVQDFVKEAVLLAGLRHRCK